MTMPRPHDECAAISAGKLAGSSSVRGRTDKAVALRLAVAAGGTDLVLPRVRPHAIHRVLHQLAPGLDPATSEAAAVNAVLIRTPRSLGLFCRRNPDWLFAQLAGVNTTT